MYSVEDLLISHGYKLPKSGPPSATTPYDKPRHADCHREIAESRPPGRGTLNGSEAADRGAVIYGSRQALAKGYPGDSENAGERNQRRKEAGSGNLGDAQPLGDSLATDSGFYDTPSLTYSSEQPALLEERDVSYWRRRGQDFSVLLDYADGRELRASAGFLKATEASWRPQGLIAEEYRVERQQQHQQHLQLWEDTSWLRDPDAAPGQLRVTGERKCQSLGTEEWKPAVGLGRQLSDGEGDRWAQEQQHRLRTTEGAVLPRTKAKSQSLPRVLSPDITEHSDIGLVAQSRAGLADRQRVNSTVFSGPYSRYYYSAAIGRDRWARNGGWPSGQVALLPKPRFSRPVKPPSYEIHQQTRGSSETLAIEPGGLNKPQKDRPIYYHPRGGELQRQDYFAQHSAIFGMEPPGYIPPPSYRRPPPPPQRGGQINRNEVMNYRWRGEALQWRGEGGGPVSSEAGRWFSRQTGGSWLEHYGERGVVPYRKQVVHPGYTEEQLGVGHVRYLPFDDPRVRHTISGGPGGNSLTDSDKIRNINKEIPSAKVLGQSTHDSAFSPPQGLSLNTDSRKTSLNDNDSSNRWCNRGIMIKGSDTSVATDQSCVNYPTAFQVRPPPQSRHVDPGVSEPVTQVKKSEPDPEKEKPKNVKKKLSETIFCLVSVPVPPPPPPTGTSRDQNNNDEKKPPPPDPVDSPSENKTGHLTNQSLQSTSSAEAELQALTGSIASSRSSSKVARRPPCCRPPKINHHKELKLSGSWPGNQYRDQETQTSPEAKKPAPPPPLPGPENKEAQDPAALPGPDSVTSPDSVNSSSSTAFSYPIKGVKSLKPSSNSAFSRTSSFSSQLNKSTAQPPSAPPPPPPPPPPSSSGNDVEEEAKPAACPGPGGQEAFGQFLLKPISRRPWDAIEELESINKELQDQQQSQNQNLGAKRPSVDQCIEDLNEAYKDILELGTASNNVPTTGAVQIPERIKIRLVGAEPLSKPSSLRRSIESWTVSVDPEFREVKSAFSRPAGKSVTFSKQLREELPVPPREPGSGSGFRDYRVISNFSQRRNSDGRTVKLDLLDEPPETPLSDFSPTTSTHTAAEVPWADRQPMQDASTLTSPPDYEDICQSLQKSRDSTEVNKTLTAKSKPGGSGDAEAPPGACGADSEAECPICKKESETQMRQIPMPPLHEEESSDSTNQNSPTDSSSSSDPQCAASESPTEDRDTEVGPADSDSNQSVSNPGPDWRMQLSLTDKNVGGDEKANQAEGEDLGKLYEVKSAEGIPENESIEERAARILGIDVPAESLVTGEHRVRELEPAAGEEIQLTESDPVIAGEAPESSVNEQTLNVKDECEEEEVIRSTVPDKQEEPQDKETQEVQEPPRRSSGVWTHLGREPVLPEFPPDRLPLSVPLNPDHTLSLSVEGERRSRGPSQRIEELQDKLTTSPSRVALERLARMKEVDSVSRMRRLSIRSTDSGEGEPEGERAGEREANGGRREEEPPPTLQRDTVSVEDREVGLSPPQVSEETVLQDEEVPSLSEAYDPSRVERV